MTTKVELIKKMKEAADDAERWPSSMKILDEMRLNADAYFDNRKTEGADGGEPQAKADSRE